MRGHQETTAPFRALMIAVIIVIGVAAFFGLRIASIIVPPKVGVAALVEAGDALSYRMTEGRLSGGFAHKPFAERLREEGRSPLKFKAVVSRVRSEASERHAGGIASLLAGDHDRAVATLDYLARTERPDPAVLSDLSVAYHLRASVRNHVADHAAALDAAERAWQLRKTRETAWNRAIALAAFHVSVPARHAWEDVLRLERDPAWRQEAQQRKAALETQTEAAEWRRLHSRLQHDASARDMAVRRFPSRALDYVENELLPRWASAQVGGDVVQATAILELARPIASMLEEQNERFAADALEAIEVACASSTQCDEIARAHVRYDQGLELLSGQNSEPAALAFKEAEAAFDSVGSPYAFAARFRRGACLLHSNQFGEAAKSGAALLAAIDDRPYQTLHGRARWLLGLAKLHQARPEESMEQYRAARKRFAYARDSGNVGSIDVLLADAFEYAGDRDLAMEHRLAALRTMRQSGETKHLELALFEAGTSMSRQGRMWAADVLLAESTRLAATRGRHVVAALAAMGRSALAARRRDFSAASEQARLATAYSRQMVDPGQRALVAANANQFVDFGSSAAAVRKLSEAIQFFEKAGNRAWLPQLLRQRALVREREQDRATAEADLRRSIDLAEQVLDGAAPAAMRDGFADDIRGGYEDLIRLLVARGAWRDALSIAERARRIGGRRARNDQEVLEAIEALHPSASAAVLEVQADALYVWLVRRGEVRFFRSQAPSMRLRELTKQLGKEPSPAVRTSLYDLLLRHWIEHVPRGTTLAILPPPALADVPVAALIRREDGHAVIEDYAVTFVSSLESLRGGPVTILRSDAALIVGDPAYRNFQRLPASRSEAIQVAQLYAKPVLLLGDRATGAHVVSHLGDATVFQFGGHAIANELAPELSSIMLAPEGGGDDTRVYVHELLQRRLPMKLVVLAACSTARGGSDSVRGSLSIARAFLDGGARTVVGTQWPVSDLAAAAFSRSFHRALTRGEDVVRASRTAQLHVRSKIPGDPSWGAFRVFQGSGLR